MKNKTRTINVTVNELNTPTANNPYKLRISFLEGSCFFVDDNDGRGYTLDQAQHFAFAIRDCIKPQNLKQ